MSKKCTALSREAHFQVKILKALHVRSTFGSSDVEKVHAVAARSTFRSQKCKKLTGSWTLFGSWDVEKVHAVAARSKFRSQHARTTFGRSDVVSRGRHTGLCTLSQVSKTCGFCSISQNDGRRGTFEEDLQRCIFCGRRSTRDMFIRAVRRSGRWFPERGCILEHQIFRFAEMILRDRCSTSYDLASIFRGRRSTLDRWRWSGKIAKRIGTRPSALHSTFHFWRKSRRTASFFDLVNFKKWGSLAELLRFLILSTSKNEDVSQNCFVFDVVKFKNWRILAEYLGFQACRYTDR